MSNGEIWIVQMPLMTDKSTSVIPILKKKRDKNGFNQSGLQALICLFGFVQAPERFCIHLFM